MFTVLYSLHVFRGGTPRERVDCLLSQGSHCEGEGGGRVVGGGDKHLRGENREVSSIRRGLSRLPVDWTL